MKEIKPIVTFIFLCLSVLCILTQANEEFEETTEELRYNSTDEDVPAVFSSKDNFVPGSPRNLTVIDVTSTTIKISWIEPNKTNEGAIHGYRIYSIHNSQTLNHIPLFKPDPDVGSGPYFYTLMNLKPFTEYKIYVVAVTKLNDGDASPMIVQRTDVSGPSSPFILNLTCTGENSLYLKWRKPEAFYNSIDYYIISYRNFATDIFKDIKIDNASSAHEEIAMLLPNLTFNAIYEVKVRAASISIIKPQQMILGSYSQSRKVEFNPGCEKKSVSLPNDKFNFNIFYAVSIGLSLLILITLILLLWKSYFYLENGNNQSPISTVDWNVPIEMGGEIKTAVLKDSFAEHTAKLHADGDIGFSKEYELIQNENLNDGYSSEFSLHPDNKAKNRYLNIIAYDHSRVPLYSLNNPKKDGGTYINANFIDGYDRPRAFIGTQGPLPDTFDCFWQMVWEQNVEKIIMITNLIERGRRKCDRYWPINEATYGHINVKLIKEDVLSTYTVRIFSIRNIKLNKKKYQKPERNVYQYHYTNWPDHGTPPDHPLPVLNFVKTSSSYTSGPIIVHCSAGVGRTGTYIMLDVMMRQIKDRGSVNVFGFLRHIRTQRNFLVQTEEQYIFLHDALSEVIISGETCFSRCELERLANDNEFMEQQYMQIINFQPKNLDLTSAMSQCNVEKNRSVIIPLENSRVHLTPKPTIEGSDYINATWLHGFRRLKDFIVTQHPLPLTVSDFWQMVWDHNCEAIVLLSAVNEAFSHFWPKDQELLKSDYYQIKYSHESKSEQYSMIHLSMLSIQGDYESDVTIFQLYNWPDFSRPQSIFQQIHHVYKSISYMNRGPIVVVDESGGTAACTFCVTASVMMELEYDNTANIYTYAKLHHNKRPGIWTNTIDIKRLFEIGSLYHGNLDLCKLTTLQTEFDDTMLAKAAVDLHSKANTNGFSTIQSPVPNNKVGSTNGGNIIVNIRDEIDDPTNNFSLEVHDGVIDDN